MLHVGLAFAGVLAVIACVSAKPAALQCQDLQPGSCTTFHDAKPDLCSDPTFSQTMCKRFCGNCPVECYSCTNALLDPHDCNTTRACRPNEQCVTRTLTTKDGRNEYLFGCELSELCGLLAGGFGKRDLQEIGESDASDGARYERDVMMRCCTGDLCNVEAQPTTTKSPTTATIPTQTHRQTRKTTTQTPTTTTDMQTTHKTTHKPTTLHKLTTHRATHKPTTVHNQTTHRRTHHPTTTHRPTHPPPSHVYCQKDLAFIMETRLVHNPVSGLVGRAAGEPSSRATSHPSTYRTASQWIPFVQQIVSRITFGENHTHVAVVTFGHLTHITWELNKYSTHTDIQHALTHLGKQHIAIVGHDQSPAIAFDRTAHAVFLYGDHGDRHGDNNVVVVLDMGAFNHTVPHLQSALNALHSRSHNVIEVNVGSAADAGHAGIATNSHQKFQVSTFEKLSGLVTRIVSLICA